MRYVGRMRLLAILFAAVCHGEIRGVEDDRELVPPEAVTCWRVGGDDGIESIFSLCFSPDGKMLATGGGNGTLRLWNVATGKPLRQWRAHRSPSPTGEVGRNVNSLAFSADSTRLASAGEDSTVCVWETATGQLVCRCQTDWTKPYRVAFSPDGKRVAAGDTWQGVLFVWEAATGKRLRKWQAHQSRGRFPAEICGLCFAPDGRALVSAGGDFTVRFWEPSAAKPVRQLDGHHGPIYAVRFSPDECMIASGGEDKTVRLWDAHNGRPLRLLRGHRKAVCSVDFLVNGAIIASCDRDDSLRLWEAATGRQIAHWRWPLKQEHGGIDHLVSSPTDMRLATTCWQNHHVLLWNVERALWAPAPQSLRLRPAEVKSLWAELGGRDTHRAYQVVGILAAAPQQVLPFLQEHLHPAVGPDPRSVQKLLAELDSDDFAVRQKASRELERLGALVDPDLLHVLENRPSLEVRRRVEALLAKRDEHEWSAEELQGLRAVLVLERLGTPASRRLLEKLAGGGKGA